MLYIENYICVPSDNTIDRIRIKALKSEFRLNVIIFLIKNYFDYKDLIYGCNS